MRAAIEALLNGGDLERQAAAFIIPANR